MVSINPLTDLSGIVTRQTLFDMWANAELGTIQLADLDATFIPLSAGSSFSEAPSSPRPGQLYWHISEALMFCWHDVIDGTGVSQWLAIGPDRFETAALAVGPIPAGCAVVPSGQGGRKVACYFRQPNTTNSTTHPVIGFNQSGINDPMTPHLPRLNGSGVTVFGGDTTPSGSWFRLGIDGIMWGVGAREGSTFADLQDSLAFAATGVSQGMMTLDGNAMVRNPGGIGHMVGVSLWNLGISSTGALNASLPWYNFKFIFNPRFSDPDFFT